MMSFKLFVKLILFVVYSNTAAQIIQPCNVKDEVCINKSANLALSKISDGIPAVGVEPSDPLFVEKIDGNLSNLKYTLTNSTVKGFKNCKISNVKLNLDKMKILFDMSCTNIVVTGDYNIKGQLIILPVEGEGQYTIDAKEYLIGMNADIKEMTGKDGKDHLAIKTFKTTLEAKDKIEFEFKNLFHGQKDLSDAVHKFANENWKEVADFVQEPVFNTSLKKIISHINKYLKTIPYEDLFLH